MVITFLHCLIQFLKEIKLQNKGYFLMIYRSLYNSQLWDSCGFGCNWDFECDLAISTENNIILELSFMSMFKKTCS